LDNHALQEVNASQDTVILIMMETDMLLLMVQNPADIFSNRQVLIVMIIIMMLALVRQDFLQLIGETEALIITAMEVQLKAVIVNHVPVIVLEELLLNVLYYAPEILIQG
jgi:rRNA-processing protein FCF1